MKAESSTRSVRWNAPKWKSRGSKDTCYKCRFIDTTTASPFREDYNPAHPLTRSQDRAYKMKLLEFCSRNCKLVVAQRPELIRLFRMWTITKAC